MYMSGAAPRLSLAAAMVLRAIAAGYVYGFDIMDSTGLPSGTIYPALRRMEGAGLVASVWEDAKVAQSEQRPARKYYKLTTSGRLAFEGAAERYGLPAPKLRVHKTAPARR